MKCVDVIIIGAGNRGQTYAQYAKVAPQEMRVVAVAEPREWHRNFIGEQHQLPENRRFISWEDVAQLPKFADAVIISTQDEMHVDPVLAFSALGYDILLEKPMATSPEGCKKIYESIKQNKNLLALCHVLRYTPYTQTLKKIIDSGAIGEVVAVQHMEPIGYWHQAHSFVRGNWRREDESSSMLLQKSCHDIDWIRYIVGKPIAQLSSFGNLTFFRAENAPEGAAKRCIECPTHIAQECAYSACKIYYNFLNENRLGWPLDVVVETPTSATLEFALKTGPYGRCVFACDNDVMDHQSVNIAFESGEHATFLASAFTPKGTRTSVIAGTKGCIYGDFTQIELFDYLTDTCKQIPIPVDDTPLDGHGGGDGQLMQNFIQAVREQNENIIISGLQESYESYMAVFAAEKSRKEGRIVSLGDT